MVAQGTWRPARLVGLVAAATVLGACSTVLVPSGDGGTVAVPAAAFGPTGSIAASSSDRGDDDRNGGSSVSASAGGNGGTNGGNGGTNGGNGEFDDDGDDNESWDG